MSAQQHALLAKDGTHCNWPLVPCCMRSSLARHSHLSSVQQFAGSVYSIVYDTVCTKCSLQPAGPKQRMHLMETCAAARLAP